MEPIQVACPECAAQPGERCMTNDPSYMRQIPINYFHAKRIEAAQFISGINHTGETPTKEEFDDAMKGLDI